MTVTETQTDADADAGVSAQADAHADTGAHADTRTHADTATDAAPRTHAPVDPHPPRHRRREDTDPATPTPGPRRGVEVAVAAAVAVLAFAVSWWRLPADVRGVVWAEDGRNFLMDALQRGVWGSVSYPYAGYLHGWPRVTAVVVERTLPVERWADGMAAGAFVATAVVALVVFVCSRDLVGRLPVRTATTVRVLLASVAVLVPIAPHEVLGNEANVHTYFLWMMPWVLLYRPRSWWGASALAVVVLAGTLTETQALLFTPLLLLQLHPRHRRAWPVGAAFLVGVSFQLVTWLTADQARGQSGRASIDLASLVQGFAVNGSMTTFLPRPAIGAVLAASGAWTALVFVVPFAAALVWVLVRGDRRQRTLAVTLAVAAVALWCAAVVLNPKPAYLYDGMSPEFLRYAWVSRYGMFPACAGLALVVLALVVPTDGRARRVRFVRPLVGVLVLAVVLVQFRPLSPTLRTDGPEWARTVAAARAACADLDGDQRIRVLTSPTTQQDVPGPPDRQWPAPIWNVEMSCAVVEGASLSDGGRPVPADPVPLAPFD